MNINTHLIFLSLIFPVLCNPVPDAAQDAAGPGPGLYRVPSDIGAADADFKPDTYASRPPAIDLSEPPAPSGSGLQSDVSSGGAETYASLPIAIADTGAKPGLDKLSSSQGTQTAQGSTLDAAPNGGGPKTGKKSGQGAFTTLNGPKNFGGSSALYEVEFSSGDVDGKCRENIRIKGRALSGAEQVDDTFRPECEPKPGRSVYYGDDEVMVGSPTQNCLVYGLEEVPDRLIVKEDNKLKVKTYKHPKTERTLNAVEREKVEQLFLELEQQYVIPREQRSLADVDAIHMKITAFLHKIPAKGGKKDGGEGDGKDGDGQTGGGGGGGVDSEASGGEPCCCLKIINYIKDTLQGLGLCGSLGSEGEKVPLDPAVMKKDGAPDSHNLTT